MKIDMNYNHQFFDESTETAIRTQYVQLKKN